MLDVCIHAGCHGARAPNSSMCYYHTTGKHAENKDVQPTPVTTRTPLTQLVGEFPVAPPPEDANRAGRRHGDRRSDEATMSDRYPKYYKRIPKGIESVDIYAICQMFPVDDATGCINHARKKLLIPGTRTGGKSMYKDIKEARDTLNRWLELNLIEPTKENPLGME
jgi:hypothetical protein